MKNTYTIVLQKLIDTTLHKIPEELVILVFKYLEDRNNEYSLTRVSVQERWSFRVVAEYPRIHRMISYKYENPVCFQMISVVFNNFH
jgi:hypothetical protein